MKRECPIGANKREFASYVAFRANRKRGGSHVPTFEDYRTLYKKGKPLYRFGLTKYDK